MSIQRPHGAKFGLREIVPLMLSGQQFDPLPFFCTLDQQYGPFSYHQLGFFEVYLVTGPEAAQEIMVTHADKFHKGRFVHAAFDLLLGNGLLLSEGDFWKRQRKLAQPSFHSKRIEAYAEAIVSAAQKMLARWQDGALISIDHEMMAVTLEIVVKTLFSADVSEQGPRVSQLMDMILPAANTELELVAPLPPWVPLPSRVRLKAATQELDQMISTIIAERRALGADYDNGDLLSMLMLARDDDGQPMSDRQLRDEVMTMFLAGHETTAMTLTWAWYVLSQQPQVLATLHDEVMRVLGDRTATFADLAQLPYSDMVIKETLRLYPSAVGANRKAIEDVQIQGYTIPKGAEVSLQFYAMHRSERYFDKPLDFIPERFDKANEKNIPRYAYLPFGAGPRVCIGNQFAMMEARLILVTMVQQFALALQPDQTVKPKQAVTLRPSAPIMMRIAKQTPVLA
jgi:cytochrome P450